MIPIFMNIRALKNAWLIRCEKAKFLLKYSIITINPNCLSVEKAISFLASVSTNADMLANKFVTLPITKMFIKIVWEGVSMQRYIR